VLGPDADDATLIRAAARNHTSWMGRAAEATGGAVFETQGLTWAAPAPGGEAMLLFPSGKASGAALDAVIEGARERGARGIGCWAAGLQPFDDLAERLMERGFEWGWQPHWMAIDLSRLPLDEDDPRVSLDDEVPEYDGYGAALLTLAKARPQRSWHALARIDGAFAGRAWAHLDDGELASAGIYDVDVPRRLRRRGIGRAVTLAVCRAAADAGARVATLNATGEGELLYRALGFRSLGLGQTWWLHNLSFTER
jgi:ribosomal protein S18 acetylase RimI-like enzyme